jgi:hypothetical protein
VLGVFKSLMTHPLTRELDINSPDAISVHRQLIAAKPLLLDVYESWYGDFAKSAAATAHLGLPRVEIGCGASHLERYVPDVIKTDVVPHDNVDRVVDGTARDRDSVTERPSAVSSGSGLAHMVLRKQIQGPGTVSMYRDISSIGAGERKIQVSQRLLSYPHMSTGRHGPVAASRHKNR